MYKDRLKTWENENFSHTRADRKFEIKNINSETGL